MTSWAEVKRKSLSGITANDGLCHLLETAPPSMQGGHMKRHKTIPLWLEEFSKAMNLIQIITAGFIKLVRGLAV